MMKKLAARAGLVAVGALAFGVVSTPVASASVGVSVSGCESLGTSGGHTRMLCQASVSGGVAPYSYVWAGVQAASFPAKPHRAWQQGECNVYSNYQVKVTVTDATGATATSPSTSFYCDPIAW
jgi:hypothetical protein